jgi:hypothetical protein
MILGAPVVEISAEADIKGDFAGAYLTTTKAKHEATMRRKSPNNALFIGVFMVL